MVKALHIICGKCGNGDTANMFRVSVEPNPEEDQPDVFIHCQNCSEVTEISEVIYG